MVNKKRLCSVLMAGVTLVSTTGFTACSNIFKEEDTIGVQLNDDYRSGLISTLMSDFSTVKYIELGDYYVIEEDIYIYDSENNTSKYVKTNTYTISKSVAISEGIYELIENKLATQNSIRH